MDDDATVRAAALLRRIAAVCAALMVVVVVASAFLRHHQASAALQSQWAAEVALARQLHRVAATLVLLGAIALALLARRSRQHAKAREALALVGVALLLSVLGLAAGPSRAAPVVLANLIGGFAMLALCARLARQRIGADRGAALLLALLVLQAAGGAWASATAPPACSAWVGCAVIATLHRMAGIVVSLGVVAFGANVGWRRGEASGAALALIGVLLLMVGAVSALLGVAAVPILVVIHGALAALGVAVLAARA